MAERRKKPGRHPERKRAGKEEERTMQERGIGEPKAPAKGLQQQASRPAEEQARPEGRPHEHGEAERVPVVGIGASAGGLQALEDLFSAVPVETGIAFVVITHTDPKHESMLPGLLEKKTKLPVQIVEEGMAPAPDTVYLSRSSRDPVLEKGVFHLQERRAQSEVHMPVDLFLKSLAEELEELAGCVILSGTGTDGTQGLRLIKERAGLAVAQDPASARHPGMPDSAIETGLVDYVLPAADIPKCLIRYFSGPVALRVEKKQGPDPLRRILSFLRNRTRHDFFLYKESTLVRRIERRMTVKRSRNASDYLGLLSRDPDEIETLFQELLIGVTGFFRDPDAFDYLKKHVLSKLVSREARESLRIWVPGCATGEEVYSVAILVQELEEEKELSPGIQIFGTDIDPRAIEKARYGSYVENIASDVTPDRLKRFFIRERNRYRVRPDIRERVVFAEQNVLADPPFSKLGLLVCRNLLIYLKQEAQNRMIPLFHYAIRDGGFLFLGSSEGVGRFQDLFEPLSKQHSIYRKKNHTVRPEVQFPTGRKLRQETGKPSPEEGPERETLARAVGRELMEKYTPPCVVVNRRGEILHIHGRTGRYLEPSQGEPSLVIGDMAREGLRFPLLTALRVLDDEGKTEIRERDVRVKVNHEYQQIDLVVRGFSKEHLRDLRMVIFEELPEPPPAPHEEYDARERDGQKLVELEQELLRVRHDYRGAVEELQSTNEELRSSNEELQSSNEELQSTNEELESSREELESLNEELSTVNSELNSKIYELRESYKAINAVLNSTRIAIVFLDNEMRVRRFTSEASELLNLIDSDVGRPLEHITHKLEYDSLVEDARSVMRDLSSQDREVRSRDGHWYRMRIMVYRPKEGVIEGVVLTFISIDTQKKAQGELEELKNRELSSARHFAESIVNTVREAFLVLDSRMRVVQANRRFYHTFRTSPEETEGKGIFELGDGQWDIPVLRSLLHEIVREEKAFDDYLVEHQFPEIGFRRMLLNARLLQEEESQEARILLAMEDVTGRTKDG